MVSEAPGARDREAGVGPVAGVRLPAPVGVSAEGVMPLIASLPVLRTAIATFTVWPDVLVGGALARPAGRGRWRAPPAPGSRSGRAGGSEGRSRDRRAAASC